MKQPRQRRRHLRSAAAGGLIALALGACGGGDASPGAVSTDAPDVAAPADESEDEAPLVAPEEMTAEDGWVPLHDLELPEAGLVTLLVNGERVDLEVTCTGAGPVEGNPRLLFLFGLNARGETADGRKVGLNAERKVLAPEPPEDKFYDYLGQEDVLFQLVTEIDGKAGQAVMRSPSDWDSAGTRLPMLHVSADGGFTVDEEIGLLPMSHEDALHGHIQVAGQCQEGWPESRG